MLTLESADAAATAQTLQQSLQGKTAAPGMPPVMVVAEPMTNSIIIRNASKADLATLRDLVAKMDTAVAALVSKTFRPNHMDPNDLATALNNRFVTGPGKNPGATSVKVTASPAPSRSRPPLT